MFASIEEKLKKGKSDFFVVIMVLIVGFGSFGLGRLSALEGEREERAINYPIVVHSEMLLEEEGSQEVAAVESSLDEPVVASKNGSKYHLPWCGGASQIKESNKIWFNSPEEARTAGYEPAKNCKGIR